MVGVGDVMSRFVGGCQTGHEVYLFKGKVLRDGIAEFQVAIVDGVEGPAKNTNSQYQTPSMATNCTSILLRFASSIVIIE